MCCEDVRIARKRYTRQTTVPVTTVPSLLVARNENRILFDVLNLTGGVLWISPNPDVKPNEGFRMAGAGLASAFSNAWELYAQSQNWYVVTDAVLGGNVILFETFLPEGMCNE